MRKKIQFAGILAVFVAISFALVYIIRQSGTYPSGSDTMCHLYKGDALYKEIRNGNFYPLFDSMWYNGVEMMRYWAPLPVYILAGCEAIAKGSVTNGYLCFAALIFLAGAVVWLVIGYRRNRIWMGAFIGILWFFMPNNLHAFFVEGNLPRAVCMVFLPAFVDYVHRFLLEDDWKSIAKLVPCFSLMALCHTGYAGMIALALIIYLAIYYCLYHQRRKVLYCLVGVVLGFLLTGIWAYASLKGGITSTDSSQVMKGFFQDFLISINPMYRVSNGVGTTFYYGLAAFLLAIFGTVCSHRKSIPGFLMSIIILICTTTTMYSVLVLLPGSQYLWMLRFISIALCFTLYSLLLWESLRIIPLLLVCVCLLLDVLPSYQLLYGYGEHQTVKERYQNTEESSLIAEAKNITKQRLTLMDESSMGATAAYLISGYEDGVQATFGAGWQSAATANNIVQLNQAMDDGKYQYLFDRCLELGSDTVLIQNSHLKDPEHDMEKLDAAATQIGYELVDYNSNFRLYHIETPEGFGTISTYKAIGIGKSAGLMSLSYPMIEETMSTNLNDYTYEQLSQYEVIYLAGFTYDDKESAEKLLVDLSEAGVKIVIIADGMPTDTKTGIGNFLGVNALSISFSNGYPTIETKDSSYECDLFARGYQSWSTVYLDGLDDIYASVGELDENLPFIGTVKNKNIVMIGLNFTYHYALTGDATAGKLLDSIFTLDSTEMPERIVVPLSVTYHNKSIAITSDYEDVNTSLADHDIFSSEQETTTKNNLIHVNEGTTIIIMSYPYLLEGGLVTLISLVAYIWFVMRMRKLYRKDKVVSVNTIMKQAS